MLQLVVAKTNSSEMMIIEGDRQSLVLPLSIWQTNTYIDIQFLMRNEQNWVILSYSSLDTKKWSPQHTSATRTVNRTRNNQNGLQYYDTVIYWIWKSYPLSCALLHHCAKQSGSKGGCTITASAPASICSKTAIDEVKEHHKWPCRDHDITKCDDIPTTPLR